MKKLNLLGGIAINLFAGGLLAACLGLAPGLGLLFAFVLGFIPGAPTGVLGMAVQKEIWISTIVEGLFADNSFLTKAFNADEFVDQGKTVHIPNAGTASSTTKNRSEFPATVGSRADVDLSFDLDEYTTDPIKISNAESVELSYNKRESVIRTDRKTLIKTTSESILYSWLPTSAYTIGTTGGSVAAHTPSGTGHRRAFVKDDVLAAMNKFNEQDVPQEDRYMLVDAVMYGQLLKSLTLQESQAFHSTADLKKGVLGQLLSFNVMMRSRAGLYTGAVVKKEWSSAAAATDKAAALAWHEGSVCRAMGEVKMYGSEDNPLYYGDVYSFGVRAGGRPMRNDVKGLLAIVQTNYEDTATELSGLATSVGTLAPVFNAAVKAYTVAVTNATTALTITATAGVTGQVIKLNGTTLTSGTASASQSIAVGDNYFTIKVTSKDGSASEFVELVVTRAAS